MLVKNNLYTLSKIKDYTYLQHIETTKNTSNEKIHFSLMLEYIATGEVHPRVDHIKAYII